MAQILAPQGPRFGYPQYGPPNGYAAPVQSWGPPVAGYAGAGQHFGPAAAPAGPWGAANGWQAQPAWPANPTNGNGGRARWWMAAGGAAAVALATAVAVVGLTSGGGSASQTSATGGIHVPAPPVRTEPSKEAPTADPAPRASGISDSSLPAMLPAIPAVAQMTGAVALEPIDKMNGPGMFSDDANPAQCVGVVTAAAKNAYAGSGVRSTYVQALREQDRHNLHTIFNAVSTFDSGSAASSFVSQQLAIWQGCQSAPVVLDPSEAKPTTWTVQDAAQSGDNLTARIAMRETSAVCQRALTARRNVVIDVTSCSTDPGATAATLASAIADRVGQQT